MNQKPVLTQLNNGILSGPNAMPLKDLNSDNDDSFAQNRALFQKSYVKPINLSIKQTTQSIEQRRAPGIQHGFIIQGGATVNQKKWIGGNRDSSQVTKNRRVNTTGTIISNTGQQSFTNIRDNNTRIDALARVRGGGYMVPPKVTQKNVQPINTTLLPTYYRIISAGYQAYHNSNNQEIMNAAGMYPGFYTYTQSNTAGTPIVSPDSFARSYNILVINTDTGSTSTKRFDIFGYKTNEDLMISYLDNLSENDIVIIATYDEPSKTDSEPRAQKTLSQEFVSKIQEFGASSDFGSYDGTYEGSSLPSSVGFLQYRSAYVLVGSKGLGVGNGIERHKGNITSDPAALIDMRIAVQNGTYRLINSNV
jgi:hypothetical protein